MKHILADDNVDVLARLAWSRTVVAFDFDGTLAAIVSDRRSAALRKATLALLQRVCELYPCAVISGRSRSDVSARLEGVDVKYIVGNHGLEPGVDLDRFEADVAAVLPRLHLELDGLSGVEIENKRYSLAIHYRRSRHKGAVRRRIAAAAAGTPNMRVIAGKLVVNLVPRGAASKGDAVLRVRAAEGADTAVYVGDDVTDEDVFVLDQPGRLLGIRVGRSLRSAAMYFVRDQREVDRLLQTLIAFEGRRRE
jgi:trehalose 6-phosphate phosphatase